VLSGRFRAVKADLTTDRLDGSYDVVWRSLALHHVQDPDGLLRSVTRPLVEGGRLAIADLDEDPDGAFLADKVNFDAHHGFSRKRLAEQLARAGLPSKPRPSSRVTASSAPFCAWRPKPLTTWVSLING